MYTPYSVKVIRYDWADSEYLIRKQIPFSRVDDRGADILGLSHLLLLTQLCQELASGNF